MQEGKFTRTRTYAHTGPSTHKLGKLLMHKSEDHHLHHHQMINSGLRPISPRVPPRPPLAISLGTCRASGGETVLTLTALGVEYRHDVSGRCDLRLFMSLC